MDAPPGTLMFQGGPDGWWYPDYPHQYPVITSMHLGKHSISSVKAFCTCKGRVWVSHGITWHSVWIWFPSAGVFCAERVLTMGKAHSLVGCTTFGPLPQQLPQVVPDTLNYLPHGVHFGGVHMVPIAARLESKRHYVWHSSMPLLLAGGRWLGKEFLAYLYIPPCLHHKRKRLSSLPYCTVASSEGFAQISGIAAAEHIKRGNPVGIAFQW